jgi:YgiT-type zinc finger domain-containing protein
MKCSLCKTGETHPGKTTVTLERDGSVIVIVIRDVPAEICEDCGEDYLDEVATRRVYMAAEQACSRHVEVEIQRYAA